MYLFDYQKKRQQRRRLFIALCIAGCIAIGFSGKMIYDRLAYEEDGLLHVFPSTTEVYVHGRLYGSVYEDLQTFVDLHPVLFENITHTSRSLEEYQMLFSDVSAFSVGVWQTDQGQEVVRLALVCNAIACVDEKEKVLQGFGLIVKRSDMMVLADNVAGVEITNENTLEQVFKKNYMPKSHPWYVYMTDSANEYVVQVMPGLLGNMVWDVVYGEAEFPLVLALHIQDDTLVATSHPNVLSEKAQTIDALYRFEQKAPFVRVRNMPLSHILKQVLQPYIDDTTPDTRTTPGFFTRLHIESELLGGSNIDTLIAPESNFLVVGLRDISSPLALAGQLASYDLPDLVEIDLGDGDVGREYRAQIHDDIEEYSLFAQDGGYRSMRQGQKSWYMSYGVVEDMLAFSNSELFWEALPVEYEQKNIDVLCRSGETAYFSRFLPEQAAQFGLSVFGVNAFSDGVLICLR